jgi:GTP cyclohydrolase IA
MKRTISQNIDDMGLAWPSKGAMVRRHESAEEEQKRIDDIAFHVKAILELLGEDPSREGIIKTPHRYAKALLFFTRGYEESITTVINEAVFEEDHDEMVIVRDIEVNSLCEHHMVPILGIVC